MGFQVSIPVPLLRSLRLRAPHQGVQQTSFHKAFPNSLDGGCSSFQRFGDPLIAPGWALGSLTRFHHDSRMHLATR
jgi:hypothetical protein